MNGEFGTSLVGETSISHCVVLTLRADKHLIGGGKIAMTIRMTDYTVIKRDEATIMSIHKRLGHGCKANILLGYERKDSGVLEYKVQMPYY